MFKINFYHQTAAAEVPALPAGIITREDFTLFNVDKMTVAQILSTLRLDTIDFVTNNQLTWGASDFVVRGVPVRVKLTESYDVVYIFDGETVFTSKDAAAHIEQQVVQF